jgi:hypothetical protein
VGSEIGKGKQLLIELHYFPCIRYLVYLYVFKRVIIDPEDKYTKQTYRNRCRINGANKIENLIIPTRKALLASNKSRIIEIDHQQKWKNKHWRAIQSAYGKAPFFEYYGQEIQDVFNKTTASLFVFSQRLLTKCLEILEMDVTLEFDAENSDYDKNGVYDARNRITPKTESMNDKIYAPEKYFQVFGNNFVPNLSIIDLIFCEGPQASSILKNCCASQ